MNIPILSDFNKTISRSYGVLEESLGAAFRLVYFRNLLLEEKPARSVFRSRI